MEVGQKLHVLNLALCKRLPREPQKGEPQENVSPDFTGPGLYLLPLRQVEGDKYEVVPTPPSPGYPPNYPPDAPGRRRPPAHLPRQPGSASSVQKYSEAVNLTTSVRAGSVSDGYSFRRSRFRLGRSPRQREHQRRRRKCQRQDHRDAQRRLHAGSPRPRPTSGAITRLPSDPSGEHHAVGRARRLRRASEGQAHQRREDRPQQEAEQHQRKPRRRTVGRARPGCRSRRPPPRPPRRSAATLPARRRRPVQQQRRQQARRQERRPERRQHPCRPAVARAQVGQVRRRPDADGSLPAGRRTGTPGRSATGRRWTAARRNRRACGARPGTAPARPPAAPAPGTARPARRPCGGTPAVGPARPTAPASPGRRAR